MICIIAAYDKNRVIGRDGALPWSLKKDMERFKNITFGHTVVMGRKTYDSIGHPLKNRRNIVFSRNGLFSAEGCEKCDNVDDILNLAKNETVFIIGGESIYRLFIEYADILYITEIDALFSGDRFFPEFNKSAYLCDEKTVTDGSTVLHFKTYRKNKR